jgi:hypothetical protein
MEKEIEDKQRELMGMRSAEYAGAGAQGKYLDIYFFNLKTEISAKPTRTPVKTSGVVPARAPGSNPSPGRGPAPVKASQPVNGNQPVNGSQPSPSRAPMPSRVNGNQPANGNGPVNGIPARGPLTKSAGPPPANSGSPLNKSTGRPLPPPGRVNWNNNPARQ